jgi:hypothetical protein
MVWYRGGGGWALWHRGGNNAPGNTADPYLTLCEVKVLGRGGVLLQGTPSQSSTFHDAIAQRAVDQNTDTDYSSGSCSRTGFGKLRSGNVVETWWKLALSSEQWIGEVQVGHGWHLCVCTCMESMTLQVWSRADCCSGMCCGVLSQSRVPDCPDESKYVTDCARYQAAVFAGESQCGTLNSTTAMQTVACNRKASYIKIELTFERPVCKRGNHDYSSRGLCYWCAGFLLFVFQLCDPRN